MNRNTQEKLEALHQAYVESLPDKVIEIESYWKEIEQGSYNEELWQDFYRAVHSLAGSSGTFGFNNLCQVLFNLETFLKKFEEEFPVDEDKQTITKLLFKVRETLMLEMSNKNHKSL